MFGRQPGHGCSGHLRLAWLLSTSMLQVPPALVRNLKEAARDQGPTGLPEQPVQSGIAGILDSTGSY